MCACDLDGFFDLTFVFGIRSAGDVVVSTICSAATPDSYGATSGSDAIQ